MLRDNIHKRSKLQERRAARDYNGVTTPGSGNGWKQKADVHTDNYLIECKTTTKKSYSLDIEVFIRLFFQAVIENKDPLMEIEFASHSKTLVIMDKEDFLARQF
jgi:hypothetical protein